MRRRETAFDEFEEPQKRGDAAEAVINSDILVRNVPVLVPASDYEPYDVVVELDGSFYRIQCMTASDARPGTVQFETRSTRVTTAGYERESYVGEAD